MVRLKVRRCEELLLTYKMFQFQMVRLKVCSILFHSFLNNPLLIVSIPNGSIKSNKPFALHFGITMFQFQMVRLKARKSLTTRCLDGSFNSKWFD